MYLRFKLVLENHYVDHFPSITDDNIINDEKNKKILSYGVEELIMKNNSIILSENAKKLVYPIKEPTSTVIKDNVKTLFELQDVSFDFKKQDKLGSNVLLSIVKKTNNPLFVVFLDHWCSMYENVILFKLNTDKPQGILFYILLKNRILDTEPEYKKHLPINTEKFIDFLYIIHSFDNYSLHLCKDFDEGKRELDYKSYKESFEMK